MLMDQNKEDLSEREALDKDSIKLVAYSLTVSSTVMENHFSVWNE